MGFNQCTIMGHMQREPRDLGGKGVGFTIVETFTKRDGGTGATYHECVAWGNAGEEVASNFTAGDPILVAGSIGYQLRDLNSEGKKIPRAQINVFKAVPPPGPNPQREAMNDDYPEVKVSHEIPDRAMPAADEDIPF